RAAAKVAAVTAPAVPYYTVTCSECDKEVVTFARTLENEQQAVMLAHLWQDHPEIVERPHMLPFVELLRVMDIRPCDPPVVREAPPAPAPSLTALAIGRALARLYVKALET